STFSRTYSLAQECYRRCKGTGSVIGLPFAVSEEASAVYLRLVSKYFLPLKVEQLAAFVNNEVSAFKLLGKPFDIEHPILTFLGDFTDRYRFEAILEQIAWRLQGRLIPLTSEVPTTEGFV